MDRALDLFLSVSTRRDASGSGGTPIFETLKALQDSPSVCYIVDNRLRLVYCNPAWDHFAEANGGHHLIRESIIGQALFASIPTELVEAYAQAFRSVASTGRIWTKVYECSSPALFRKLRMRIHPLRSRDWFLVTNSLVVERPHRKITSVGMDEYTDRGIVTLCAHCRCARRLGSVEIWDFVPKFLRLKGLDLLSVSHGLCPICLAYFYPNL